MRFVRGLLAMALLAGCAGMGGPDLVPGKSTAKDVTAAMGKPAMELKRPNGDQLLYFTTFPWGRETKVATIGSNGVLRGVEQRLTANNVQSIKPGMRKEQVLELLGPPRQETPDARKQTVVLEYPWMTGNGRKRISWVHISGDGSVREVIEREDYEAEPSE